MLGLLRDLSRAEPSLASSTDVLLHLMLVSSNALSQRQPGAIDISTNFGTRIKPNLKFGNVEWLYGVQPVPTSAAPSHL